MKVSKETEQYILDNCPPWCLRLDAPDSFKELQRYKTERMIGSDEPLPVYGDPDNPNPEYLNTIFSSPEVHYAFRAWHDNLHLANGRGFNMVGEFVVGGIQYALLRQAGIDRTSAMLVYLNTVAQIEYYYAMKDSGKSPYIDPNYQEEFITLAYERGISYAITDYNIMMERQNAWDGS